MGLIKRTIRRTVVRPARRKARTAARRAAGHATVTCGTCGKRYANPLTHTCAVKTDFRQRKAAQARREKAARRREAAAAKRRAAAERKRQRAAAARARRKEAAQRRKAAAAERRKAARARPPAPRPRQAHDYRTCRDQDCERHVCTVFREGIEACPLPHQG